MITIILATIFGIAFAWIASQNTSNVPVTLAGQTLGIPLYILGAITFLIGVFVASIFSIFDLGRESFKLAKREADIKNIMKSNENLQNIIEKLKNENLRLQQELNAIKSETKTKVFQERKQNVKNFFGRIFPNSSTIKETHSA